MRVHIGPLIVQLDISPEPVAEQVAARYAAWLVDGQSHAVLHAHVEPSSAIVDLARTPVRTEEGTFRWREDGCKLRIAADRGQGWLEGKCADPLAAIEYALRCLTALATWRHGGLLLHASAVAVRDQAVLFVGPSGAGKSTAAQLRPPGTRLLADDLTPVRFTRDGWVAYASPFLATSADSPPLPVGLLCVPIQATATALLPLSPSRALPHVLQALPLITYYPRAMRTLLPQIRERLTRMPAIALYFNATPEFWPLILKMLERRSDATQS